ncbi:MAG: PqqD family protein [Cyanobacteria bacterium J06600_6]
MNSSDVVCETIDGEVVIVNLQRGDYYSLLRTATDIWSRIETGADREGLIKDLLKKYNAQASEITEAVEKFITVLQREGLISVEQVAKPTYVSPSIEVILSQEDKLDFEWPEIEKFTDMEDLLLLDPIHEADQEKGWPIAKDAVANDVR